MSVRLIAGDCREVMTSLPDNSVHAIVTDPPYGLGFMGKEWDRFTAGDSPMRRRAEMDAVNTGATRQGGRQRACADYAKRQAADMRAFQAWCEEWVVECLRVLRPGGFMVAFGGTRTFHRLVCAIEDGGFEVRDMLAWLYGSGFPKSTDKAKIPEAWRGWNTALKPAIEPICLARKPMDGTLAENLTRWGTGALWIDGCRIEGMADRPGSTPPSDGARGSMAGALPRQEYEPNALGRWPANVMHDGSEEVLAAFPDAVGQIADASSSSSSRKTQHVYGAMRRGNGRDGEPSADSDNDGAVGFKMKPGARRGDAGSAARFFYCPKADRADRNAGLEGMPEKPLLWSSGAQNPGAFQSPNTHRAAQNHHPTVKPTELMRWLVRLVTPPGGTVLDPFLGSGSTLKAADIEGFDGIGIEREAEYIDIARRRISGDAPLFTEVAA